MTAPGKNKSIWFDQKSLERLNSIVDEYERRTGMRPSDSSVVCRALESLFLAECLSKTSNATDARQPESVAA